MFDNRKNSPRGQGPRWQPQESPSWDPAPHHPAHDRHGHLPHPSHSRHDRPLHSANGQQGAAATLEKVIPPQDVEWLTRAMRGGPPEMRAEFLLLVAIIEHQLHQCEAISTTIPHFDLFDPAEGEANLRALSITLSASEQQVCLQDLMRGPPEVQAIAYLTLLALRLAEIASTSATIDEIEADV